MLQARLKAPIGHEVAYFHVIFRLVNREFTPGAEERERFCGVRVRVPQFAAE